MIKFFRRIRQRLLIESKISRYLLYAIGEIILVVIGILIALSINNWNSERIDAKKERLILMEIQENLNEDLQNIDLILGLNDEKIKTIDTAFIYISKMKEQPLIGRELSNLFPVITNYKLFSPIAVAFNNLIASGKIDILSSNELRKQIWRYYSNNEVDGVQEQLTVSTQNFLADVAPKMMNKNLMKAVTKLDFEVNSVDQITIYKDPHVLSDLFILRNKTLVLNRLLKTVRVETESLGNAIENHLKTKN